LRPLSIAISLIALAGTSAAARDAGVSYEPNQGAASAARLAAVFGTVTSTYRSVEHNRLVGGVPNSYHLSGRAIDIARKPGVTHSQIAAALSRAGYRLIESLDEGDHSHFAFAAVDAAPSANPLATGGKARSESKIERRLLADDHGTLVLDLQSGTSGTGTGTGR
jgi:hypothetical protein